MVLPTWENAVQWNERDLANSAPERFLHPHAFILIDHIIHQMAAVLEALRVDPERMKENMERAKGLMMAESVMIALTETGIGRQEAHEMAREASMTAIEKGQHYRDAVAKHKAIAKALGKKGIKDAMDPARYVGPVDEIIDQVIEETKGL
jgi:adenylosuccinate lyase